MHFKRHWLAGQRVVEVKQHRAVFTHLQHRTGVAALAIGGGNYVRMRLGPQIAIAIGNLVVGGLSDRMSAAGEGHALTYVLLATDLLVLVAAVFYALAARGPRVAAALQGVVAH